jgi:hypothetical protein
MDSNKEDIGFLLGLQGKIGLLKYGSLILVILFATSIVLHVRDNKRNQRLYDDQLKENVELKAKLYDKGISKSTSVPTPEA